jgi:hypothetical protein
MNQPFTFLGLILKIAYELRRHRLLGLCMDWLIVMSSLFAGAILFYRSEPIWAGVLVGFASASLMLMGLARQFDYLRFRPNPDGKRIAGRDPLEPDQQVRVRATGPFAVREQRRHLVDQPAIYTTPQSREHIVMTKLELSRLLVVGKSDPDAWGWWYQFFRPEQIELVELGHAIHGLRSRPAIRIAYWMEDEKERQQQLQTVLSFEDVEHRALVWSDLIREQRNSDSTPWPSNASQRSECDPNESGAWFRG